MKKLAVAGASQPIIDLLTTLKKNYPQLDCVVYERSGIINYNIQKLDNFFLDFDQDLLQYIEAHRIMPDDLPFPVKVNCELENFDLHNKAITVYDYLSGLNYTDHYDALLLSNYRNFAPEIFNALSVNNDLFYLTKFDDLINLYNNFQKHGLPNDIVVIGNPKQWPNLKAFAQQEKISITFFDVENNVHSKTAVSDTYLLHDICEVDALNRVVRTNDEKSIKFDMVIIATSYMQIVNLFADNAKQLSFSEEMLILETEKGTQPIKLLNNSEAILVKEGRIINLVQWLGACLGGVII